MWEKQWRDFLDDKKQARSGDLIWSMQGNCILAKTLWDEEIYIFGIAMDLQEKEEVINEANKIYDVDQVIPSIYLATELSRSKL